MAQPMNMATVASALQGQAAHHLAFPPSHSHLQEADDDLDAAEDDDSSSSTAAQGHCDIADQDEIDIAAWMDALEADEDTACWASFQARVSPEQEQV